MAPGSQVPASLICIPPRGFRQAQSYGGGGFSFMAGFPLLFAHVGRKINSTAPLKVVKFSGSKTKIVILVRCSSAAPAWFLPVLLRKTGKNARKASLSLSLFSAFLLDYCGFVRDSPPPKKKLIKSPEINQVSHVDRPA